MNKWRGEERVVEAGTVKSNLGHAELATEEGASVMDGWVAGKVFHKKTL